MAFKYARSIQGNSHAATAQIRRKVEQAIVDGVDPFEVVALAKREQKRSA